MQTVVEKDVEPVVVVEPIRRERSPREYVGLLLRGYAMGAADVVPGVSGGTMAFILGIYEELIHSIKSVASRDFVKAVVSLRWREALGILNWPFLLAVAGGILLAILTLAQGLEWLLEAQPALLWSFFFGLVLASVLTVSRRILHWTPVLVLALIVGAVGAYLLVGLVPVQTPNTWWFLFLSGALAICAMILPGISGAFILLLLGKYQYVLSAVNQRDIVTLGLVVAGAAMGIVTFAQVLDWLFKRYHDLTVALLTGLMLGSLRKVWPWKETVEWIVDRHGNQLPVVEHNILPGALTADVVLAVLLALVGFGAVLLMDRWANKQGKPASKHA
jgi:putative membrane protein